MFGSRIVDRLRTEAGTEVVTLGRRPGGDTHVQADITDLAALREVAGRHPKIDTLVHLAAAVPRTSDEDRPSTMACVNVAGTANLLEAFGAGLRRVVYASTAEVYGVPELDAGLLPESRRPEPRSQYGASKLAGEHICSAWASATGRSLATLRYTVLYGPGDTIARAIPNFVTRALRGQPIEVFGGDELRDYLHVDDAADATYLAATGAGVGTFNVGTGRATSVHAAALAVAEAVGRPDLIAVRPRAQRGADIVLDVARAEELLDFRAQYAFPDRLEEQVQWHRDNDNR